MLHVIRVLGAALDLDTIALLPSYVLETVRGAVWRL